ncbi:hypothetical protein B0H11DRAFT_2241071 [Mycena galericulata]|nr:hypothetical protein B0H11DRAFT_2241071 [Mycena galericulata]
MEQATPSRKEAARAESAKAMDEAAAKHGQAGVVWASPTTTPFLLHLVTLLIPLVFPTPLAAL